MSNFLFGLAIFAGLAVLVSTRLDRRFAQGVVVLSGLGAVGGLVAMYLGHAQDLVGALSITALAGLAALPSQIRDADLRRAAMGTAAPLAILVATVGFLASTNAGGSAQGWLLITAQWSAVMATVVLAIAAASISDFRVTGQGSKDPRAIGPGLPLALVGAAAIGGVALIGLARATTPAGTYALPLSSEAGAVKWTLIVDGSQFMSLQAVAAVDWALPVLLATMGLVLAAGLVKHVARLPWIVSVGLWAAGAVGAWGALLGILATATDVALPARDLYEALAGRLMGLERLPEQVTKTGEFVVQGDVFVSWAHLAPEIVGLGLAGAIAAISAARLVFADRTTSPEATPCGAHVGMLHSRDLWLRTLLFASLAWLLTLFVHWQFYGVIGFSAPAEWLALGVLFVSVGLVMLAWPRPRGIVGQAARALVPGVIASLFVLAVAVAYVFGGSFGVSILY